MKKLYYLIGIIILTFSVNVFSQEIPNGGFEAWDQGIWTNNPVNWDTDNTEVSAPVFQDTSSYEGEFAMTLTPDINGLGEGDAEAESLIPIDIVPAQLEFYARWERIIGEIKVEISFFNETNEYFTETWVPTNDQSDWTLIVIPLPQIEPIITHAIVRATVQVGDLAYATLSIDDMQFGNPNGIPENTEVILDVYPNPTADLLNIACDRKLYNHGEMAVINDVGQTLYQGLISRKLDLQNYPSGIYFLQIQNDNFQTVRKFTINR